MNSRIHLHIKTSSYKELMEEAGKNQISLSALCRLRLCKHHQLERIEHMLQLLLKRKKC
jgi:hypothetical protein